MLDNQRKLVLDDIDKLGLDKSYFRVFQSEEPDSFNMTLEGNDYIVNYIDDRGNKEYINSFKDVVLAKKYLIDLYKISGGEEPIFSKIITKEDFNTHKNEILNLLEENTFDKNKLEILIKDFQFNNYKASISQIRDYLVAESFYLPKNIFEKIFLFIGKL